jgi:ribosome-associated toxin RatA of RatAB toxin-antitoxin module
MDSRIPARRQHHIARVTPRELYDIVVDFPAYPRLFPEIKSSQVLSRTGNVARVEFRAQMVLPIRYVLDLTCVSDPPGGGPLTVEWKFVEGEVVTNNEGSWRFAPERDGTAIEYAGILDVRAPVPAFILRKIIDGLVVASLPNMFSSLEREVRRRQAAPASSSTTT